MELTITRSLLVILIPGAIATSPWILLLVLNFEFLQTNYEKYTVISNFLLVGIIVIAGSIIEGFNTYLERRWDKERDSKYDVMENWFDYLSVSIASEPVGFRYISNRATFMYFELAMRLAVLSFFAGLSMLAIFNLDRGMELMLLIVLNTIGICSSYYFRKEAKTTHKVLCITRKEINTRIKEQMKVKIEAIENK